MGHSNLENLNISLIHPSLKSHKPVHLVIIYRPTAPYSEFLSQFSEILSKRVLRTDKVITVGDFNIHVHDANDFFQQFIVQ